MSTDRRVLTLHPSLPREVVNELLTAIEGALERVHARRVWIDTRIGSETVVMAELLDSDEQALDHELEDVVGDLLGDRDAVDRPA